MRNHANPLLQDAALNIPPTQIARRLKRKHHTNKLKPKDEWTATLKTCMRSNKPHDILFTFICDIATICFLFLKTEVTYCQ